MPAAGAWTRKPVLELVILLWIVSTIIIPYGKATSSLTIVSNPRNGATKYLNPMGVTVTLTFPNVTTIIRSSTSTWTSTQTVGLVTQYSYLYQTVTQWATTYLTQTTGTTSTINYYSTIRTTTTGFVKTETTPITVSQTRSTTETSYGMISVTKYVYIQSYTQNQNIKNTTTEQPSNTTTGVGSLLRFPFTYAQLSQYGLLLSIVSMIVVGAYAGFKRLSSRP